MHNNQQPVRVLHVFDRVCNLINADDAVVSLVTPEIGNGPFNIVVPPVRFPGHITPDSQIVCQSDALIIGNLAIDITNVQNWNSRPDWYALQKNRHLLHNAIPQLIAALRNLSPANSFASFVVNLPEPDSAIEREMLRVARVHVDKLMQGLSSRNRALCLESVVELAGLGDGLTPAGDDWIMGCTLAAHILANPIAPLLAITAAGRTTALSAAWLRAAARGECDERWHSLFDAILKDDEPANYAAAVKITQQGHTSGSDALAGFVAISQTIIYNPP